MLVLNLAWLAIVPFAMPGNWLMIITTLSFAWYAQDAQLYSTPTLVTIVLLAFLGEVVEFFAGMGGAKRAGASFIGSVGAIIGAVTGAILGTFLIPIPIIGTLLGSCVGAGFGTWTLERIKGKTHDESLKSGLGAGVGQFVGLITKLAIGITIWVIIAVALFM